ncbi:MAG: hypothetical protein ABEI99_12175 [Halobaculum sp.]
MDHDRRSGGKSVEREADLRPLCRGDPPPSVYRDRYWDRNAKRSVLVTDCEAEFEVARRVAADGE